MNNKPFNERTPNWVWILPFVLLITVVSAGLVRLGGHIAITTPTQGGNTEQQKTDEKMKKEAEDKEFLRKRDKLGADMAENINEVVGSGGTFSDAYIDQVGDDLKLKLTVSGDWYYLAEFQRDRLLRDAWTYFNLLGVKYDLREEDSLPWKVTLVDRYGERLAGQGWW